MGHVWSWSVVKKSMNNPYIKIPKEIMEKIDKTVPKMYYILMTDDKDTLNRIMRCLEKLEREGER